MSDHCSWCGIIPSATDPESTLVRGERPPHVAVCGRCISFAVVKFYEGGVSLDSLRERLLGLFVIPAAREREIKDDVLRELRERYQREFLELRDRSEPEFDEARKTQIVSSVTKYTYDRIVALSREANMTVSQWVRQAIVFAFHATSHKRS